MRSRRATQTCKNIILTGPPGSGKTTLLKRIKGLARVVDEVARDVIKEWDGGNKWGKGKDIQDEIYKRTKSEVERAGKGDEDWVVFDRTHIDCLAYGYIPERAPEPIADAEVWVLKFHPEWYVNDNQRKESAEEAEAIGEKLKKVYKDLGYKVREIDAADPSTWPKWAKKRLEFKASMRTRRAAPEVERTKPGSENDFRVTYTGYKRWTNDRPGDGIDPNKEKKLKDLFDRLDVKRSLKKLEKATATYVKSGDKAPIDKAADAMRLDNGVEVSMDVLRHVHKVEKAQLDKQESPSQKKVVEALNMAKKKIKNASMVDRVARSMVATYGDVNLVVGLSDVFELNADMTEDDVSLMQKVLFDSIVANGQVIEDILKRQVELDPRYGKMTNRVASEFLNKFREEVPTLWLENEAGDKWVPKLDGDDPAVPNGFVYQHSMFPDQLQESILKLVQRDEVDACLHLPEHVGATGGWIDGIEGRECKDCRGTQTKKNIGEPWPSEWEAVGSRSIMTGNYGWNPELVLALVSRGGFDLRQAIIISARSCEACMNVLAEEVGLDWGYALDSEDFQKCGTSCFFCDGTGLRIVSKQAGVGDVLNKIIQRIRDPFKRKEMGQAVMDYAKTKDDNKDMDPRDQRLLYRQDDYSDTLPLSKKKDIDIGWTDHAEYRSDLRDRDPDDVNEAIRDILKNRMVPQKGKKPNLNPSQPVKLKAPGIGTMVVDYDLTDKPADANLITLWASDMAKLAKDILTAPRPDCADCVRKHLAQAGVLIQEALQGYPTHFWLAIGHLAEAEAESQNRWPEFANKLRAERKRMETDKGYCPNIVELINEVTAMIRMENER